MNDIQSIKSVLLPYLKGLVFIVILVMLATSLTFRALGYVTPMYESKVKMRVENNSDGVSSLDLYKNFNMFSVSNKIKTEEEILKSDELLTLAVQKMNEPIQYYRVGEVLTSEMYDDSPFFITDYKVEDKMYNKEIRISFSSDSTFSIACGTMSYDGSVSERIKLPHGELVVNLNPQIIEEKGSDSLYGELYCKILDERSRVSFLKENITVSSIDKDVPIIRISFKDAVPQRAAKIVNTVAECYIEDYINNKARAAEKTVNFISKQLEIVSKNLSDSEIALENFKRKYNVINTLQETETGLKGISQLQLNLIGLQVESVAMDSVLTSLNDGGLLSPISTNFEAFADLTFTEIIKDINSLLAERRKLLLKYQDDNERIVLIEQRLLELKTFLHDGIAKSKHSIHIKIKSLEAQIAESQTQFDDLPEREMNRIILEREFLLNQKIYNFLSEKRIESSIAQAATITFHRIIERGYAAKAPVSPNKKFLSVIAGFLVVMISILFIYLKTNFASRAQSRAEVERHSAIPVIGIIPRIRKGRDDLLFPFTTIVTELLVKKKVERHQLLTITSASKKEGKTFVSEHLAQAFASQGWNTLVIDYNPYNKCLSHHFDTLGEVGLLSHYDHSDGLLSAVQLIAENLSIIPCGELSEVPQHSLNSAKLALAIAELRTHYDIVIVDTPANTITNEALMLIKQSEHVLQVIRSGKTRTHMINQADLLADIYELETMNLLINYSSKAFNFNGALTGSRYSYNQDKGLFSIVKRYIEFYLR